jgi:ribonucleoside-diphosphate reductase alpha chain
MNLSDNAKTVMERRYLLPGEKPEELFRRVAHHIASFNDSEELEDKFYEAMTSLKFLPNSPTLMNAGTGQGTLSACFVLPLDDTMEGIMDTAKDAAMVQKFGGGTGFSLSKIRPKAAPISTTHGKACGPIAVLNHLSSVSRLVTQGGKRDGANMAVLHVSHPDIMDFITCKQVEGDIHNFNISVGVDAKFMDAVRHDSLYALRDPASRATTDTVRARDIWNAIIDNAWRNGEPGIIFLDTVNREHSKLGLGEITATNPCGEQPLLPNESCNLGSIDVSKFTGKGNFDWEELEKYVRLGVQFLDNVIDANEYATEGISKQTLGTRKIGLGVMGFADALVRLSIPYDSDQARQLGARLFQFFRDIADHESETLALLRGAYPFSNDGLYRNACRLTIAPTGTISMLADCSSGIEPLFALSFTKQNILDQGTGSVAVEYINRDLDNRLGEADRKRLRAGEPLSQIRPDLTEVYKTSGEISVDGHVRMQAAFQRYCDSGVSKTINLPNTASRGDIAQAYLLAEAEGCKGITVYRAGSRDKEVLTETLDPCPECGSEVANEEGCHKCYSCGWSAC